MSLQKSESNNALIAKLKNVRKHPNADRLQLATVVGETVIVGLDAKEDDLVIYFDSNLALSNDYCKYNNLFSKSELNADTSKKGYFGKNGRVKAQLFRGERSYGYTAKIESLFAIPTLDVLNQLEWIKKIKEGDEFTSVSGIKICEKYIPEVSKVKCQGQGKQKSGRGYKTNMFVEHYDTKHFKRCVDKIPVGRLLYIEEKAHGSSQRSGQVLADRDLNWFEKLLIKFCKVKIQVKEWICMNGTRRVNLTKKPSKNSFYKGDMRNISFDKIKDHLHKNEQLYYELVGYDTNGSWIQKPFPYGCKVGEHKVILYRVTFNNEDGKVFDMGREYVYQRADELGMLRPHLFEKYFYSGDLNELHSVVDKYTDGQSAMDKNTLREGVVIHFEDANGNWTALKNKSFAFLERESKAKDKEDFVDIEDEG